MAEYRCIVLYSAIDFLWACCKIDNGKQGRWTAGVSVAVCLIDKMGSQNDVCLLVSSLQACSTVENLWHPALANSKSDRNESKTMLSATENEKANKDPRGRLLAHS